MHSTEQWLKIKLLSAEANTIKNIKAMISSSSKEMAREQKRMWWQQDLVLDKFTAVTVHRLSGQ